MKSNYYYYKKEEAEETKMWDAFVNYLDTVYFPGASQELETKLVTFEFEHFKVEHTV